MGVRPKDLSNLHADGSQEQMLGKECSWGEQGRFAVYLYICFSSIEEHISQQVWDPEVLLLVLLLLILRKQ